MELWESVTSVSNAGKKRGRGKLAGKGKTKNLNMGQRIGEGERRVVLPGLNTNVKQGDKVAKQTFDTPDPNWYDCDELIVLNKTKISKRMFILNFIGKINFINFVTPLKHGNDIN